MKKIRYILLVIATITFAISCEDDGGTSVIPLDEGAAPNMVKDASSSQIIDLIKLTNGEAITLGFKAEVAQGKPASTDIVGIYTTAAGPVYRADLFSNATLPGDFSLTVPDIVSAFSEITSTADIQLGDVLTITTRFTMDNGAVLEILSPDGVTGGTGTNIATTVLFTTVINYPVSCPSDIGGNYTVVSSGFSTDGAPVNNPLVDFSYDVVLTDNGGGSYTISDGVAGVYQDWYCAPYGYCFETPGNFTDVCGVLSGSWTESFGCQVDLTGIVNPDGTLTIQWVNCFGDTIEEAIYTPN